MAEETNPIEDAKKLLAEDQAKRIADCKREIEEVLKKYNCELKTTPIQVNISAL